MENIENNRNSREQPAFLISEAKRKKEEGSKDYEPHFADIDNADSLSDEAINLFGKYNRHDLTEQELIEFEKKIYARDQKELNFENSVDHEEVRKKIESGESSYEEHKERIINFKKNMDFFDYWKNKTTDAGERAKEISANQMLTAWLRNRVVSEKKK